MKKARYKDQNNENYKKIVIVLFVVIFILMLVNGILGIIQKRVEDENKEIVYEEISSIEEVIEYHKSIYFSEKISMEKDIYLEVKVEFCKLLYENDKSNEEYFNELLNDCAKVLRYRSFYLIDSKNGITIKVICKNQKIASIIINDIEDYFIYMDSQISMKNFKEIKTTPLNIESEILQSCINENWNKAINFIPLKGEVIIYLTDDTHPFSRLKVGDGVTSVIGLPFVSHDFQA